MRKPSFYGHLCDTGQLAIRCAVDYACSEVGIWDLSTIEMKVEVWTSVPFGKEQRRAHCMEVFIPDPITDSKYEDAYKRVLLTYQDFFRAEGAVPPPAWRDDLARACGSAMDRFMTKVHRAGN